MFYLLLFPHNTICRDEKAGHASQVVSVLCFRLQDVQETVYLVVGT